MPSSCHVALVFAAMLVTPLAVSAQCTGSCRSATATSGTLQIFDSACTTSTKWSTRNALSVVKKCQTFETTSTLTVQAGSCRQSNGQWKADGFQYVKIKCAAGRASSACIAFFQPSAAPTTSCIQLL